jgi:UDP-2,4-diacetamido-2,4,6-trideoxy-beta-L-altropyranose hydrolase
MTTAAQETGLLLVRADANVAIGTGHIMRCLALAQAWQDAGGPVSFAIAEVPAALEPKIKLENFAIERIAAIPGTLHDARETAELARRLNCSWLVVDGDRFSVTFLEYVKSRGIRVLLIDDFAQRESFPVNLILNPNLGAAEADYSKRARLVPLLLGESYALLRREFTVHRTQRAFPESAVKILVTLGGSDPENLMPRIVDELALLPYEITAVAGPGHPHSNAESQARCRNVCVLFNPSNMVELMHQADLAVIAAGGTLWELLSVGCVVLSYARNPVQARVVQDLQKKGAVINLGATKDFSGTELSTAIETLARAKKVRCEMSAIGRQLVDARGAVRVVQAMRELEASS